MYNRLNVSQLKTELTRQSASTRGRKADFLTLTSLYGKLNQENMLVI